MEGTDEPSVLKALIPFLEDQILDFSTDNYTIEFKDFTTQIAVEFTVKVEDYETVNHLTIVMSKEGVIHNIYYVNRNADWSSVKDVDWARIEGLVKLKHPDFTSIRFFIDATTEGIKFFITCQTRDYDYSYYVD